MTYPVNNAIDKEGNYSKKAVAWEKAFIQLVKVCMLNCVPSIMIHATMCRLRTLKIFMKKRKLDNMRNH